jgi:glucose/arabinose dehydrogenase
MGLVRINMSYSQLITRKSCMRKVLFSVLLLVFFYAYSDELAMDKLTMPPGFHVSIFANNVKGAREMALGDKGTIFVGSNAPAKIYAIIPEKTPQGLVYSKVKTIASGLNQPQGVAFYKGDLYVAEVDRIIRYKNIEKDLDNPPPPMMVNNQFPLRKTEPDRYIQIHGWKTIHFGPDHKLYVAIGIPCNVCMREHPLEGSIARMDPDGSNLEIYTKGVRNSVGFDWQPGTNKFWFTDNGRDRLGDDFPPDKLYYAPEKGLDVGFPYYLGVDDQGRPLPDPEYGKLRSPEGITWEALNLPAHVAVLNMIFYTGHMFPDEYRDQIIVTEHGSWDRSKKVGYRLSLIKVKGGKALSYTPFITGWLQGEKNWGRPVGLLQMPDGSVLVSDDYAGVIYRVSYQKT